MLLASYTLILLTTDYSATKIMLENISATVSGLIKKPVTTFKESVSHISQHIIMNTYLYVTLLGS